MKKSAPLDKGAKQVTVEKKQQKNCVDFEEYLVCLDCLIEEAEKNPSISTWKTLKSIARDLDEKKLLKNRASEKKLFLEAIVKAIKCRDILKRGLPVVDHPKTWKLFYNC